MGAGLHDPADEGLAQDAAREGLRGAFEAEHDARRAVAELIPAAFPLGCTVRFDHGRYEQQAIVIDHGGWSQRLRVRNPETDREYWLDVRRVKL